MDLSTAPSLDTLLAARQKAAKQSTDEQDEDSKTETMAIDHSTSIGSSQAKDPSAYGFTSLTPGGPDTSF
eukprot:CAMPEP_0197060266 /NCGR_PEP_ID=MMETSP1384-20130603/125282_1 /TAXON_ID=29189 /ORGANISM="Ammonia sp." /LENGTH=69 /DNA_ID=CAMNT_0042495563 /DNA_START=47 /DNA_END=253 /DNA_ORIENTATION=+